MIEKGGTTMGISLGNQVRLSGMVSGLDTESIIKQLMKTQQTKYDKMYQTKTKAEWKRDAYNDVNTAISKFKNEYASFLSGKNMLSSSAYKSYTVDMPQNGNLSVSMSSLAKDGAYSVSIQQLASGATLSGDKASKYSGGFGVTTINSVAIKDIAGFASGEAIGEDISFSVGGTTFNFKSTDTLKKIMDTVNKSDAGVTMSYSQITDSFKFETKVSGTYDPDMVKPEQPADFNFTYTGDLTLPDPMEPPAEGAPAEELEAYEAYEAQLEAYNADFEAKRSEALEAHTATVKQYEADLTAYNANEAKNLKVTDDSGFLKAIGVDADKAITAGHEAKLTINGHEITRDSNSFELDGITFNLTKETTSDISFSVKRDVQKSVDMVKDFVNSYNTLVSVLYGSVTEKKNYSYAPLTDEQRADLKDSEIAAWDAKAKSGLLYRDTSTQTMIDDMRYAFSTAFGDNDTFSSIGLKGSAYMVGEAGTIELDEAKLTKMLEEDPDKVFDMFAKRVEDAEGKVVTKESGLVQRLAAAIDKFSTNTKSVSIKSLDADIKDWEDKMKTENNRLYTLQERYYRQYASLETALSKMQSQSSSIAGLLPS